MVESRRQRRFRNSLDGYGEDSKGDSIGYYFAENPYDEYNTYGLEWNPDEYIFYINGVETGRLSTGGVSDNPQYLILSCEVAGENGISKRRPTRYR